MPCYAVTGASRGIGLALVTKLLETKPNAFVFATTRNACKDLEELGKKYRRQLLVLELDVGNETQYAGLMAKVRTVTDRLDYVVANAGESLNAYTKAERPLMTFAAVQDCCSECKTASLSRPPPYLKPSK